MIVSSCFHLSQIVTEPTRVTDTAATLIDHVYVTDPASTVTCTTTPPLLNSDHMCICIGLKYESPYLRALPRRVWKYGAAHSDGANEALSSALPNFTLDNVNFSWNNFKSVFLTTMSTYIPNKVVAVQRSLPWLNRDLKALFHKRDSALRQAKKSSKSTHWETYKRLRNKAVAALRFAKRTYFMELSNCLSSPKRFRNAYHALSSNRQRVPHLLTHRSVTAESTPAKANLFNSLLPVFQPPKAQPRDPQLTRMACLLLPVLFK